MDYYIPLIIFVVSISYLLRRKKWAMIALTLIPLVLFWGTKVDFGPDYGNYLFRYERQHDMPILGFLLDALEGKFEPGIFFLNKIMPSFNAVVFVTSLFLIGSVYFFFNEFIPKYSFPLALFLWLFNSAIFNTFSAMRSSFVIGFFLLAIVAKTRLNNRAAILLSLIGAQFHMSGYLLVLFTVLPYDFFQKKRKYLIPFIFAFIVIALLVPSFFTGLLRIVTGSNENISSYEDYATGTNYGLGFYIFSFIRVGFIVYILYLFKRRLIKKKYIWIAWLTIFCYLLMMVQGIGIMYRVFNYLFLFTVAFKCYALKVDKSSLSKIYVGLSILYALYNFNGYMHTDMMPFYEHYHSFLF